MGRIILGLLCVMAGAAFAAQPPILFSRDTVIIHRQQVAAETIGLPWQSQKPDDALNVSVDIRPASAFFNNAGWFDLAGVTDSSGILLTYPKPVSATLRRGSIYAPLDIVFINAEGYITQIAPNLILSELKPPLASSQACFALLLIHGGYTANNRIQPGDRVEHAMFKTVPTILVLPDSNKPQDIISKKVSRE